MYILLDIVLPDMDGRVVCRLIKGMERYKDVPIIMVTSLVETADLEKAFNAGDDCLKAVAGILQDSLKRGGDMLFRYGGEEFVAILPENTLESALMLAQTMCRGVEGAKLPHSRSGVSPNVTVSLGVATTVPEAGFSYKELIAAADKAFYAAKDAGRNRVKEAAWGQ